jgi:hypothetical protein
VTRWVWDDVTACFCQWRQQLGTSGGWERGCHGPIGLARPCGLGPARPSGLSAAGKKERRVAIGVGLKRKTEKGIEKFLVCKIFMEYEIFMKDLNPNPSLNLLKKMKHRKLKVRF